MRGDTRGQRVGVFVDVQNMFYSAYDSYGGRLNYRKLLETIARQRCVIRAIAYVIRSETDQGSFLSMLREVGFEVKTKEPRLRNDGSRRGHWDIGIAIDTLLLAPKLDVVALVTGDGDFTELARTLVSLGLRVEVYGFDRNTSRELKDTATEFYPIREELILKETTESSEQKETREYEEQFLEGETTNAP